MNTGLLCCETIRNELNTVFAETGISFPCRWVESGLHNHPNLLTEKLQETLYEMTDYDRIILCFGYCGNSLLGLHSERSELIYPRVDDCISLFIGGTRKRAALCADCPTYYMTKGWLDGERNLWEEYKYTMKKYGPDTGKMIYNSMMGHYKVLGILDTGGYAVDEVKGTTQMIADTLGLELRIQEASTEYLKQLITGPWPEDKFVVIPPGKIIGADDLMVP